MIKIMALDLVGRSNTLYETKRLHETEKCRDREMSLSYSIMQSKWTVAGSGKKYAFSRKKEKENFSSEESKNFL
jgi:hypothetical protein